MITSTISLSSSASMPHSMKKLMSANKLSLGCVMSFTRSSHALAPGRGSKASTPVGVATTSSASRGTIEVRYRCRQNPRSACSVAQSAAEKHALPREMLLTLVPGGTTRVPGNDAAAADNCGGSAAGSMALNAAALMGPAGGVPGGVCDAGFSAELVDPLPLR